MGKITIRDLHRRTGDWVRRAAEGSPIVVTDRGRPVAALVPFDGASDGTRFADRRLLAEFAALGRAMGDATAEVSEDRDRG